jgi:hypothetical protein
VSQGRPHTKQQDAILEKIDRDAGDIKDRKEKILRDLGWEHYTSKIDFCWRWRKTIDGEVVTCGVDEAFHIELARVWGDEE